MLHHYLLKTKYKKNLREEFFYRSPKTRVPKKGPKWPLWGPLAPRGKMPQHSSGHPRTRLCETRPWVPLTMGCDNPTAPQPTFCRRERLRRFGITHSTTLRSQTRRVTLCHLVGGHRTLRTSEYALRALFSGDLLNVTIF